MKQRHWGPTLLCAYRGVRYCLQSERNMKLHLMAAVFVLAAGVFFGLDALRFCLLLFSIALVVTMEMVNTALERFIDLVHPDLHPLAGLIKDIAAGAVLIASLIACVIGYFVFFEMR